MKEKDWLFSVGDTVRHKTSGELGIVVQVNGTRRCKTHPGTLPSAHNIASKDLASEECEWVEKFDGTYDISIGLEKTVERVLEGLLALDEET